MNRACLILTVAFYGLSSLGYVAYLLLQKKQIHRGASILLWLGFFAQTLFLITRYVDTGIIPVHDLRATLFFFAWSITGVFLFFQLRFRLMVLGAFVAPFTTALVIAASFVPHSSGLVDPALKNLWVVLHVVAIFIGNASFVVAFGLAVIYLVQEWEIKSKKMGFFYKRFPSLSSLDSMGYASIVVGFTMLTVGIVTGAVYAQLIWGHFWSWDPKEVWSLITWLIYAALLHERLTVGWQGRRAAYMAIIGFVVLLFTFFGVNLLLKGHHTPFTRF